MPKKWGLLKIWNPRHLPSAKITHDSITQKQSNKPLNVDYQASTIVY